MATVLLSSVYPAIRASRSWSRVRPTIFAGPSGNFRGIVRTSCVIGALAVLVYLVFKVVQLMKQDEERHKQK